MEEKLKKELRNIRIQLSIKKKPLYSLKECLACYSKEKLIDIAYIHGIYQAYLQKKADIIRLLEEKLISNITNDSLFMSDLEREALAQIAIDACNETCIDTSIALQNIGYVYLFYNNDCFYPVLPVEIAEIFMTLYNEESNKEVVKRNNDIFRFSKALTEIYGVYEVDQLILIWNKYNGTKLEMTEAYEHMNTMSRLQMLYWWDEPYVVSAYFEDEDQYQDLLIDSSDRKYYIPTIDEINYYAENDFDEENIYYVKLQNYFTKRNQLDEVEIDDLMFSIQMSCVMDVPIKEILDEVINYGCSLDDLNDVNRLVNLIVEFTNNTRKWILKGHKPVELKRDDSLPTNKKYSNNIVPFPNNKVKK
ncbi:MAG: hypothetical protein K0R15_1554 [Clostridiales bacterium]|nr:hypothetical protein [Clostridiales bacterium]